MSAALAPGATIGILGGGQLGRMLAWPARRMGYRVVIFSDEAQGPAAQWADHTVAGSFDELDKVSTSDIGEEIISVLTHLTDSTQNMCFVDNYFTEFKFDLSRCLFVFSYNDADVISPILRDRMYHIQTQSYTTADKIAIATNYLLPKLYVQINLSPTDVVIPQAVIRYIIDMYCHKEAGVRALKRYLEIILTKINLCRLMKPNATIAHTTFTLPLTLTEDHVRTLIKLDAKPETHLSMYA